MPHAQESSCHRTDLCERRVLFPDATGYMQHGFHHLERRTDLSHRMCPGLPSRGSFRGLRRDCYTVVIHGQEKHLFFERTDPLFRGRVGRWFVEKGGVRS
ncbi:MAG: hypothetical protein ACLRT5_03065 [Lachnospiraceae bacterium]